jgi:hypothetical protein
LLAVRKLQLPRTGQGVEIPGQRVAAALRATIACTGYISVNAGQANRNENGNKWNYENPPNNRPADEVTSLVLGGGCLLASIPDGRETCAGQTPGSQKPLELKNPDHHR